MRPSMRFVMMGSLIATVILAGISVHTAQNPAKWTPDSHNGSRLRPSDEGTFELGPMGK